MLGNESIHAGFAGLRLSLSVRVGAQVHGKMEVDMPRRKKRVSAVLGVTGTTNLAKVIL